MRGNLRFLSTWNILGCPFDAPYICHKHDRIRRCNDENMIRLLNTSAYPIDRSSDNGEHLMVSCFQEAFSFRDVPYLLDKWRSISIDTLFNLPPASLNMAFVYECMLIVTGILHRPFLRPDKTTGKWKLHSIQSEIYNSTESMITYKYGMGMDGESISSAKPFQMLIDSGLLILSNWKPVEYAFVAYNNQPNSVFSFCTEKFSNKGMLYAYWSNQMKDVGTLVVNTHITTESRCKQCMELRELSRLIYKLRGKYKNDTKYLEIYVVGDFNIECDDPFLNDVMLEELQFERLTDYVENENDAMENNIDHIFRWSNWDREQTDSVQQQTVNPPVLIQNHTKKIMLSDHPWRAIVL
eukprot:678921_1